MASDSDRSIPNSKFPILIIPLIAAVTLAAYWPVFKGGFLWEDLLLTQYAKNNWSITRPLTFVQFSYNDLFTPLSNLVFWLEFQAFGSNPAGYFAFSVLLHIVNAIMVCLVVYLLAGKPFWAGLAGMLYAAAYPVQEAVGWIAAYVHVLAGTFYLGSLLSCLAWLKTGRWGWLAGCLAALVLGALVKEDMVTAWFFLAVVLVLIFRRSALDRRQKTIGTAAVAAIGVAYLVLLIAWHFGGRSQSLEAGGLTVGLHGIPNYRFLVGLLLPPPGYIPLMAFLNRLLPSAAVRLYDLAWLLLLPLAFWFGWALVKGTPGQRMAVLLILISFAPFSMVRVGFSQRYLYIPYMGFAILTGLTLASLFPSSKPRWLVAAAGIFLIANILVSWTWQMRVNRNAIPAGFSSNHTAEFSLLNTPTPNPSQKNLPPTPP